jgi:hypothetical protein
VVLVTKPKCCPSNAVLTLASTLGPLSCGAAGLGEADVGVGADIDAVAVADWSVVLAAAGRELVATGLVATGLVATGLVSTGLVAGAAPVRDPVPAHAESSTADATRARRFTAARTPQPSERLLDLE